MRRGERRRLNPFRQDNPLAASYLCVFLYSSGEAALHVLVPPYLSDGRGHGPAVIGTVLAIFGLSSLVTRLPVGAGYAAERVRPLLLVGGALSAGAFAVVPFTDGPVPFAALMAVDGVGWAMATTTQLAVLVSSRPSHLSITSVMGWYSGFTGLGNAVGGVAAGVVADRLGYTVGFLVLAAFPALATAVMLRSLPGQLAAASRTKDTEQPSDGERPSEGERPSDGRRSEGGRSDGERSDAKRSDGERLDGERPDAERSDADRSDADRSDGEQSDSERPDGGRPDGGRSDGGRSDGGRSDRERSDAERPDGKWPDGERSDAERSDGERPDAERPDAERPDAERPDGERSDAERPDGERLDGERSDGDGGERSDGKRSDAERSGGDGGGEQPPRSPLSVLRSVGTLPAAVYGGALIMFFINVHNALLSTFQPVLALAAGLTLTQIGILASVRSLTSSVTRLASGPLFARISGRSLTAPMFLLGVATLYLVPVVQESFWLQAAVFALAGLSRGILRVTGAATAFENAGPTQPHGLISALLHMGLDLGKVLGPPLGGTLAQWVGIPTMFKLAAITLLTTGLLFHLTTTKRHP